MMKIRTELTQRLCTACGLDEQDAARLQAGLEALGGPKGLLNAGTEAIPGLSPRGCLRLGALLGAVQLMLRPSPPTTALRGPQDVLDFLGVDLRFSPAESFWVVHVDGRGYGLSRARVATGTVNACMVHPREVFAQAMRARAAGIIAVHNHPSGDPTPSRADRALTARLFDVGELVGIPLLDHIVVGQRGFQCVDGLSGLTKPSLTDEDEPGGSPPKAA